MTKGMQASVGGGRAIFERYPAALVAIHWITAALVVLNLLLAVRFVGLEGAARGSLIRLHKSIGCSILLITGLRLLVRLRGPMPPALGEGWRRRLAANVRFALYGLLVLIPLSGWAMISAARPLRPTRVFGLFVWPTLTPIAELPPGLRTGAHDLLAALHLAAALLLVLLLATHIAGAVTHRSRDGAMPIRRMRPF